MRNQKVKIARPPKLTRRVYVGDVQGCFDELRALIAKIGRQNIDELWLTGDILNRGPKSLETLRWCKDNAYWVKVILGNHDLHFLAVAAGVRPAGARDSLQSLLNAPDKNELVDWLRQQPLMRTSGQSAMVHAGLLPQWTIEHALELNEEVSLELRSSRWPQLLGAMYGDLPNQWHAKLRGIERFRVIINAFTRLRFCTEQGAMEFASKEGAGTAPLGHAPWFAIKDAQWRTEQVIFGHWSMLGLVNTTEVVGLDTGCVWGGKLTALKPSNERQSDLQFVHVPSKFSAL